MITFKTYWTCYVHVESKFPIHSLMIVNNITHIQRSLCSLLLSLCAIGMISKVMEKQITISQFRNQ